MNQISLLSRALPILLAGAIVMPFVAGQAQAQAVDAPPPRLEKLEEPEPAKTPQKASAPRGIIESRDQRGQVTSIEVRDERGSYYVKPGSTVRNTAVGGAENDSVRPPQWKIFEFDMKRPDEPEKAGTPAAPAPPGAPARTR